MHIHIHTHTHTHTHTKSMEKSERKALQRFYTNICFFTYIHIYIHICIHIYTHTHKQYGEIGAKGFAEVLHLVEPQEGEVFVDLGSGTGKAVMLAAALYPLSKSVRSVFVCVCVEIGMHAMLSKCM